MHFEHVPGTENPADVLTKPSPWFSLKKIVEPLLPQKGNTVGAPLGASHAEGSDAGPGLTVMDGQLSQEQDSTHMIGHTILAILHSNQCAALHDTMPADNEILHGVWSVTAFN